MKNPWLELGREPVGGQYLLEIDRPFVENYNRKHAKRHEKKLMLGSIPEPFIGSFEMARLVLLNLNPGHSDEDEEQHRRPDLKDAIFKNIRQEQQPYPFYPLNPAFEHTGVGRWWRRRTKSLHFDSRLQIDQLARKLLVIEWFPYHSSQCGLGAEPDCGESQKFSHELARSLARKNEVVMVVMKAQGRWIRVDPLFAEFPSLNSKQNASITRNNTPPGVYERLLSALRSGL